MLMLHPCKGFGFVSAFPSGSLAKIHLPQENRSSETTSALRKEDGSYQHLFSVCGVLELIFTQRVVLILNAAVFLFHKILFFCKENLLQKYKGKLCCFVNCFCTVRQQIMS